MTNPVPNLGQKLGPISKGHNLRSQCRNSKILTILERLMHPYNFYDQHFPRFYQLVGQIPENVCTITDYLDLRCPSN